MATDEPLDSWETESQLSGFLAEEDTDVVAKFYSPLQADLAAAKLRTEGIPCFLSNTASQNVQTQIMNLVRLHVRLADRDRARELLQEFMPEPESSGGSVAVGLLIVLGIFAVVIALIWLLQAVIPANPPRHLPWQH